MPRSLEGKVALITGGSRGIGAAIAKRLASDGALVAITYAKDANSASAVVKSIETAGGKANAFRADAADPKAIQDAVKMTVETFGRLDILVNNAGTAIPKPFEETTLEEMDQVIDLNLRGVFVATQAALKHFEEWRPHHYYRLMCGREDDDARASGLLRDQRGRQNVYPGIIPGSRKTGHYRQ
jgi:3-oxoacyl-[acyl-carrier protein] reductase